jgi:5-formyltetrahydrofolate cyclo-ligase
MQTRPPEPDTCDTPDTFAARRQALRQQLLALRASLPDRAERERVLVNRVRRWLATMPTSRLAFYWAVRGECDLRPVVIEWLAGDAKRTAALPVIDGELLRFVAWQADTPMRDGLFGIPVPPADAPQLSPQVLLVPCVGVDQNRYRLGYGGGFYDRTLARLSPRPVTVGIGFDCGRVKNLAPQAHDIRMDLVITESGVL